MADQLLLDNIWNGDAFQLGADGERWEQNPGYKCFIDGGFVDEINDFKGDGPPPVRNMNAAVRGAHLVGNYRILRNFCQSDGEAARAAYYRVLAIKYGLINRFYTPANSHIKYTEYCDAVPAALNNVNVPDGAAAIAALGAELTPDTVAKLRVMFFDYVCILAFVFRTRGHHYLPDFGPRLNNLWVKTRRVEADIPIRWEIGFTYSLHAIPPIVLEEFWKYCARGEICDGALAKRIDSAPAGAAILSALKVGMADISVPLLQPPQIVINQLTAFGHVFDAYKADPLAYSVNASLYGKQRVRIDETQMGVVGAFVLGIYEAYADGSALAESKALSRVAGQAPVTMGIIKKVTKAIYDAHGGKLVYGDALSAIRDL